MAGGKSQRDANNMLRDQAKKSEDAQNTFTARNTADENESKAHASDLYSTLTGKYKSLAGGQGANPNTGVPTLNSAGAPGSPAAPGGGGGGGGFSNVPTNNTVGGAPTAGDLAHGGRSALMDESLKGYRDFADTGGWDPARRASMDQNIQGFKDFGKTGGIDAAGEARMRGGGVYDEFAKTGGLNDADKANIRARGNSVIPSMYGSMKDEANRMGAVQGGYGPGQSALMSRLGRQQAGAAQDAALNSELGITSQVNSGRLAGAGGMAQSEGALQGLKTGNQLAGMRGAADTEANMVNSINSGRQFGLGGIGQQGESDRSAAMNARETDLHAASVGQQGSALANQQANWEKAFAADQEHYGMEGLASLYGGQGSGEYNLNKQFQLQNNQGYNDRADMASKLKTGNANWVKDYVAPLISSIRG